MCDGFEEFIVSIMNVQPPAIYSTDKIIRFGPKNRYWCVLFGNKRCGVVGDWSTGEKHTWSVKSDSSANSSNLQRRLKAEFLQREAQKRSRQKLAAVQSEKIWSAAKLAPSNFRYLKRKQIKPDVFRLSGDGRLLVPLQNAIGQLVNLQYITEAGVKRFHYGGEVTGVYSKVGQQREFHRILICEGVATASTLSEIDSAAIVFAAMTAGNLVPVAQNVRKRYPQSEIVICGDNDRFTEGNPGKTKAIEAARTIGAEYSIPEFPVGVAGTDYNDLYCGGV